MDLLSSAEYLNQLIVDSLTDNNKAETSEEGTNNVDPKLVKENLNKEKFIFSQKGSFNHRQLGLPYRIKKAQTNKLLVPPKRVEITRTSIDLKLVQFFRMKVRAKSFKAWKKSKNAVQFNKEMSLILFVLKKVTKINHYKRTILSKDFLKAIKRKLRLLIMQIQEWLKSRPTIT